MSFENSPGHDNPVDYGTVWFAILQFARINHDERLANEAKGELASLGIRVSYGEDSSDGLFSFLQQRNGKEGA